MNWKWQKSDWVFVAGILLSALLGSVLWKVKSNPNPESVRYLLSTIPQVTGALFVIVIAFMQMLGNLPLKDFIKRPEFVVTASITLVGIAFPLIILYLEGFCRLPAIALSVGFLNLTTIGWFIIRIAPAQDIAKAQIKEPQSSLRLEDLRQNAQKALASNVPSSAISIIKEIAGRAKKIFKDGGDEQEAKDACTVIRDLTKEGNNYFDEVWKAASLELIEIDKLLRVGGKYDLSEEETIQALQEIGTLAKLKKYSSWPIIKVYLFQCLHEEIETDRFDLNKAYDKKRKSVWGAIKNILDIVGSASGFDHNSWVELTDSIMQEFVGAIKGKKLTSEKLCQVLWFIFNMFCKPNRRDTEIQEDLIKHFANINNLLGISRQRFLADYETCLSESKFAFVDYDPKFKSNQLQIFKKRFLSP